MEKGRQGRKGSKPDDPRSRRFHPSDFCRAHVSRGEARARVLHVPGLNPGPADAHAMATLGFPVCRMGGPESPLSGSLLWTELCSPQNVCFEALIPNAVEFGNRTSKEVMKVK